MKFPRFDYMTWAKNLECTPGLHLSSSGLPYPTLEELDLYKNPPRVHQISSYGDPQLLEAIAERSQTKVENVFLSMGSSGANYIAMGVLLEPGDEVIVEKPAYEVLAQIPLAFGANVKRITRDSENSWKINFNELKTLISDKTKLLVFTNPHNPTGATFTADELNMLKKLAEQHDFHVMFDEVFIEMVTDKFAVSSLNRSDRFVTAGSITKAFGMGGLRIGWTIATPELVERMMYFQDLMNVNVADPSMDIALRIFRNMDFFLNRGKEILRENSQIVKNWLEAHENVDFWMNPEIAFCFPSLKNISTDKWIEILDKDFNTFTVPGRFFTGYNQNFRLGYGINKETLIQGLQNFDAALRKLEG